jgi:hypothetical protein
MQHSTRVLRSAITALSALFLVAGAAFATSAFVGGNRRRLDGRAAALDQAPSATHDGGHGGGDDNGAQGGNGGHDGGGDH